MYASRKSRPKVTQPRHHRKASRGEESRRGLATLDSAGTEARLKDEDTALTRPRLVLTSMRACSRPAVSDSLAVAGPSPKCDVRTFPGVRGCRFGAPRRPPLRRLTRERASVRAVASNQDDSKLTPRVFDAVEDIRARSSSAVEESAALDAARNAVLESTEVLDPALAPFEALEAAASFVGWRVVRLTDGVEVGEVRNALAMAGGEVVAQMGGADVDEHDEHEPVRAFFSSADAAEDDRDEDEDEVWGLGDDENGDWEVIYEKEDAFEGSEGSADDDEEDDENEDEEEEDEDEDVSESVVSDPPPLSLVLRVRGEREVRGAGGAVNREPVAHLVPLVPSMFPRWNEQLETLVIDPPDGLLDLGFRQSEIRALRRDLAPYCSAVSRDALGMPRRRSLVRAGRGDLVTRVSSLGDWSSVALLLGFESSRKPDGYWENIDLLRDALLELVHAFWFEETETTASGATQTFWYNDVSGALTFEEPDVASGGGLDQPVMPAMADVIEARRWDVHQAILLHGGYKEVALALGWLPKRTSENRHLLQFSALARGGGGFIEESGDALGLPKGRFPSEAMLVSNDRDDLVQGVRWHGGFVRVARRMGKLNFAASAMADAEEAARALRAFAEARGRSDARRRSPANDASFVGGHRHARLLGIPVMPTEAQLLASGRHDLRWALRIHDRARLAALAGLADPNRADPETKTSLKMRLGYDEAREFMRNAVRPRLASARRFRDWSEDGQRPWFIPADPPKYYEERGAWVDWEDFLGTPRPPGNPQRVRAFKGYADAKQYMRDVRREFRRTNPDRDDSLSPDTSSAYKRWASSGARPRDIPRDPVAVYGKRGEWVSWDDFLGRAPGTAKRGRKPEKAHARNA